MSIERRRSIDSSNSNHSSIPALSMIGYAITHIIPQPMRRGIRFVGLATWHILSPRKNLHRLEVGGHWIRNRFTSSHEPNVTATTTITI